MKKSTLVILIFIIFVLLATIGVGAYFVIKDKNESKTKINELENKVETLTNNNSEEKEKNVSKIEEPENDIKMTSTKKIVRKITVGDATFICTEETPEITGVKTSVAKSIEKYINKYYSDIWEDIDAQTPDDEIEEMLTGMSETDSVKDIGFNQKVEIIYVNDKLVTFMYIFSGGLGGVSWGSTTGMSFDLNTGDVIKISDIVSSEEEYIDTCKEYAYKSLEKDSRFEEVKRTEKSYKKIIDNKISELSGYFTEDGIVCAEIERYEIASGGAGEFKFTVPYSEIKDYIDSEYVF